MDHNETFVLPMAKRRKLEAGGGDDQACHNDPCNDEPHDNGETLSHESPSGLSVEEAFPHGAFDFTSDDVNDIQFGAAQEVRGHAEIQQLKHFHVLDEYNPENDEDSEREEESDGDSEREELADKELERMLEEDLPESFRGTPRPKEKPYTTKQKLLIQEKGSNDLEILPLDWVMVNHCTGIPVFLHKSSRVCTLSRPYYLGTGSVRKHEFPVSAIPCLYYKTTLEEEKLKANKMNSNNSVIIDVDESNTVSQCPRAVSQTNERESGDLDVLGQNMTVASQEQRESKISDKQQNDNLQTGLTTEDTSVVEQCEVHDPILTCEKEIQGQDLSLNSDDNMDKMQQKAVTGTNATEMEETDEVPGTSKSKELDTIEDQGRPVDEVEYLNSSEVPDKEPSVNEDPSTAASLPGVLMMPTARVQSVQDNWRTKHLTHDQVIQYCKKLFIFKTINIMHFKRWADRRRFAKAKKTMQRPTLPQGTKLITIPAQLTDEAQPTAGQGQLAAPRAPQREWSMNMSGRSYVSVFHEYVRRVMQKLPVYEFQQTDNASTPYQARVLINGMKYGVGHGTSKRQAKSDAARESIQILIPELRDNIKQDDKPNFDSNEPDFSFFDMVEIEDPRIMEFCATTMEPSPHAILRTCLLRNFGTGERQIEYEMKKLKHQKMEFTMRVGKHTATVVCKNKKMGKQRASQAILQKLHPLVKSWGSLLRLYGSRSIKSCKEKKMEEQEITLLQDKATINQPNYAILDKLAREMRLLAEADRAVVPIGTLVVEDDLPTHSGSNLNNVDV